MALVNERERKLFIHVPKTAGRSITRELAGYHKVLDTHCSAGWLFSEFPQYREYDSFSVVRNPWDRMWSFYHFTTQRFVPEYAQLGFKRWLTTVTNINAEQFGPDETVVPQQVRPQTSWLCDRDNNMLVKSVLKFEEISTHFPKLQKIGASQHGPYEKGYDDETIEWVAEYFRTDIELFDYRFGA